MTSSGSKPFVSRQTQNRLLKDVRSILKYPLTEHGIHYVHDDENCMRGYALIIGPEDSLYADGMYLFVLKFPSDYPYKPPRLEFATGDGKTRFNPNLYRNGKVCLSILNTWKGEQWTSCQTIRSVLLTLVTLFHNKPLLNEPGVRETHKSFQPYNDIIRYRNYKTAILGMLNQSRLPDIFAGFFPLILNHIKKAGPGIISRLENLAKVPSNDGARVAGIYNMSDKINYSKLHGKLLLAIANLTEN